MAVLILSAAVFSASLPFIISSARGTTNTWTVDDDGTADFQTIQEAINNASAGDTIFVHSGIYQENIVLNKSLILAGENKETTILKANGVSDVIQVVTDNTTISGFTIRDAGANPNEIGHFGIKLMSNNNSITDNILTENSYHGLYLVNANYNTITQNFVHRNHWGGIVLEGSDYNTISNNNVVENLLQNNGVGVWLKDGSDVNTIENNTITRNDGGIGFMPQYSVVSCYDNIVRNNNVYDNLHGGIFIYDAGQRNLIVSNIVVNNSVGILLQSEPSYNAIVGNNISLNIHGGIGLDAPSNLFYHNNLVDNTPQVTYKSHVNSWDNGYPSGGNYWSDYNGTDADNDGIGDTPYIIDDNNQDRYPLINQSTAPVPIPLPLPTPTPTPQPTPTPTPTTNETLPTPTPIPTYNPPPPPPPPPPTPTPSPTPTATPTPTPTPSPTPEPTPTPTPPPTPSPTPTPTPQPTQTPTNTTTPEPTPTPTYTPSPTPSPTPTPTLSPNPTSTQNLTVIEVSCQSSASNSSFRGDIVGNVTSGGIGLQNVPVLLLTSLDGGTSWDALSLVNTDSNGKFSAVWTPSASGNYLLRAFWVGNTDYLGANGTISCVVTPFEKASNFLVSSNSTLSGLSFDSAAKELSFSVVGPNGTSGYVSVSIPKSLIADVSGLKVYLDGVELPYTVESQQDSWYISFSYHHSTHQVSINLDSSPTSAPLQITSEMLLILGLIITALLIFTTTLYLAVRRPSKQRQP